MHIQRIQKNNSKLCMKECFSLRRSPMAINILVLVFSYAPKGCSHCSLIARSKSIKNPLLLSPIIRFLVEMSP